MIYRQATSAFAGMEFATFKLREGVTEEQLIAHSKAVDEQFLSSQTELLAHFLLKGKEGQYADVAIATTQEKAEEICQMWLQNEVTQKYLELLDHDSVDMTFWSRIS
ncbi:hypothetical protein [Endozoicomonas arenosclerae]|uniref:hypothetical protein n=1 Tax=Endozoicomonas arenosclerae TaxID=1633495 RepID=UPI000784242F|nr:hypothetical protein [Endozoicomonas arenosclerae]